MANIEHVLLAKGEIGFDEIREDVAWGSYCDLPAMNPSTLVHGLIAADPWATSMKHLRYSWESPRKDTPALLWGRAVHCLLFEPDQFEARYVEWSGGKRYGNRWDTFQADCNEKDQEILTSEQWTSAIFAAQGFVGEPLVQELISKGKPEVTVLCTEDGIQCRGRIDWIQEGTAIVDLKTTRNIQAGKFGRDFCSFRYDIKLAMYRRWLRKLTDRDWPVKCIALENKGPYDIAVVPVDSAILDQGEEKGVRLLGELKEAILTGRWLGVAKGEPYYLDFPVYEMMTEDIDLTGVEVE